VKDNGTATEQNGLKGKSTEKKEPTQRCRRYTSLGPPFKKTDQKEWLCAAERSEKAEPEPACVKPGADLDGASEGRNGSHTKKLHSPFCRGKGRARVGNPEGISEKEGEKPVRIFQLHAQDGGTIEMYACLANEGK